MNEPITTTVNYWTPDPEKEKIKDLITQYTDELLTRAIERGEFFCEPEELPEETDKLYKEALNAIMPRPEIILEGISLLYMTAHARANARMMQYFGRTQMLPDLRKQLKLCYSMLRCLNGTWAPFNMSAVCGTGGGAAV